MHRGHRSFLTISSARCLDFFGAHAQNSQVCVRESESILGKKEQSKAKQSASVSFLSHLPTCVRPVRIQKQPAKSTERKESLTSYSSKVGLIKKKVYLLVLTTLAMSAASVEAEGDLADGFKDKVDLKEEENEDEEVVDPWTVKTSSEKGIDYDKLISEEKELGKKKPSSPVITPGLIEDCGPT